MDQPDRFPTTSLADDEVALEHLVAVELTGLSGYPTRPPFDPPERYPELGETAIDPENRVYAAVRSLLASLGLDADNQGTRAWNPLAGIVEPGMTVLVKPNAVRHENIGGKSVLAVLTHASVVRPLLDYVAIALKGRGRIVVGDSPMLFGDFARTLSVSGLAAVVDDVRRRSAVPVDCYDLRATKARAVGGVGAWAREPVRDDPAGFTWVDLGERSHFAGIDPERLRIGVAHSKEMRKRHSGGRHEYLISGTALASDAIVSVPKLKTHRRTGATLSLKAFFGLVSGRSSLPHYRLGSVAEGGDEYLRPSLRKRLRTRLNDAIHGTSVVPLQLACAVGKVALLQSGRIVPFPDPVEDGMWHGNDTLWRAVLDVQLAVLHADASGRLHDTPRRTHLAVVDGIVAGEGNGPIAPDPVEAGALLAGTTPGVVDAAAATLAGFDIARLPTIERALQELEQASPGLRERVRILVGGERLALDDFGARYNLRLRPHPNWVGHVERP